MKQYDRLFIGILLFGNFYYQTKGCFFDELSIFCMKKIDLLINIMNISMERWNTYWNEINLRDS
jgi:hypothetical protein